MPEDFGGLEGGELSEASGEVSEEAQQRVRENAAKAKQVRTQIQQVQQQNQQFAKMLSLLLQYIDDDQVLGYLFAQLTDLHISVPAIFAQFLPYLKTRIDIEEYKNLYDALWSKLPTQLNVSSYVAWLHSVRKMSPSLEKIKPELYIPFVLSYLRRQDIIDINTLDEQQKTDLMTALHRNFGGKVGDMVELDGEE